MKTSDAVASGVSRTVLGDFVRKYGLGRVAHGLYMSQDAWEDGLYVIQVRYPKAVFSHETALYLLNLANREPSPFSLTLKTGTNSAGLSKQGIKVYKVKEELFGKGIVEVRSTSGHTIRAYNAERTICDLFRSRRNIEIQDFQEGIKTYIRQKGKNIPLLMRYAEAFSVEKNCLSVFGGALIMIRTSPQLKALVRNISKGDSAKAQIIIRSYVMERFLERLSLSQYKNNMILKGKYRIRSGYCLKSAPYPSLRTIWKRCCGKGRNPSCPRPFLSAQAN